MNGLQLPPALHFCVTRPNTQPGVAEAFAADLAHGGRVRQVTPAADAQERLDVRRRRRHPRPRTASKPRMLDYLDATHEVGPD